MNTKEATDQRLVEEPRPDRQDRSTRRFLVALLVLLGMGTLALLILLFWLLRSEATTTAGVEGGYPIRVVTTIYGYGETPDTFVSWPLGVTWDDAGNVWISNTGQGRVDQFTRDGGFVRSVGGEAGPGKLSAPYGLTVDSTTDRTYVADPGAGFVQVYSASTGGYVTHFPADDQDLEVFGEDGFVPYDVEVVGGRVVVTSNDGLYFFDESGHMVSRWGGWTHKGKGIRGADPGMFNFPDALTVDPTTGRIYVADSLNRRVVALGAEGRWLWVSGIGDEDGRIRSFWQLPRGIEVGPDGNLYVVDTFRADQEGMGTGHLLVLSPEGELLSEFGRTGASDGSFAFPEQIAAGPDGLWALADRENNRVVIFELITPYPEVEDIYADRYPRTFEDLTDQMVSSTPTPSPVG